MIEEAVSAMRLHTNKRVSISTLELAVKVGCMYDIHNVCEEKAPLVGWISISFSELDCLPKKLSRSIVAL